MSNYKMYWLISIACAIASLVLAFNDVSWALFDSAEEKAAAEVAIMNAKTDNEIKLQRAYEDLYQARMLLASMGVKEASSGPPWWFWLWSIIAIIAGAVIALIWVASRRNQGRQVPVNSSEYLLIPREKLYEIEGR